MCGLDGTVIAANNCRMSILSIIRTFLVCLGSIGLGIPAYAAGGCCCDRETGPGDSQQVEKQSCCGPSHADLSASPSQFQCSQDQTCRCETPTARVSQEPARLAHPPQDLPLSLDLDALISKANAPNLFVATPPASHNIRLARLSVWRK